MEISSRLQLQHRENQSPMNSPRTSFNNSNNSIGLHVPNTPPMTPKTVPRSDSNNPYPTTFVQADSSTFKQVVQMLTGSQESTKPTTPQPPSSRNFNIPPKKKHQGFKLYERRNSNMKNRLMINTLLPNLAHNNKHEILSPSLLDFPSLSLLSPITPLNDHDPFDKSSSSSLGSSSEEDKAIAEKGFYLHPSPMSTPREFEPQLLPLFPLSSPRVSESPS
ncbi:PREDICTED: VQ motif-containing protein 33-like isoform X1 [Lupinus angustifolius]|nr:PREDICTED: VQ motif-containing protein 33-like isoform X1 [Lupinus angustifolius]